ncbi:adhesin-like protein, partial [Reticulomyxa filosa]
IPRFQGQAILINSIVLLVGGMSVDNTYHSLALTEMFDLSNDTYLGFATSLFQSRHGCGVAYHPTQKLLFVVGGFDQGAGTMTWEYLDLGQQQITDYLVTGVYICRGTTMQVYMHTVIVLLFLFFFSFSFSPFLTKKKKQPNSLNLSKYSLGNVLTTDDLQEAYQLSLAYKSFNVIVLTDIFVNRQNILYVTDKNSALTIACNTSIIGRPCVVEISADIDNQFLLVEPLAIFANIAILIKGFQFDVYTQSIGGVYYFETADFHEINTTLYDIQIDLYIELENPPLYHVSSGGELTLQTVWVNGNLFSSMDPVLYTWGKTQLLNVSIFDAGSNGSTRGPIYIRNGPVRIDGLWTERSFSYTGNIYLSTVFSTIISNVTCKNNTEGVITYASCVVVIFAEGEVFMSDVYIENTRALFSGGLIFINSQARHVVQNVIAQNVTGSFYGAISCPYCRKDMYVSNVSMTNCLITESSFGAGIYFNSYDFVVGLHCTNCNFYGCGCRAGGGIAIEGGFSVLRNCNFINNFAYKAGGGILMNGGSVDVIDSLFDGNIADSGAGIVFEPVAQEKLTVNGSIFRNNIVASSGAAIGLPLSGIYDVHYCIFEGNVAKVDGGGLYDGNGYADCKASRSYLSNCQFRSNLAQQVCLFVCLFVVGGGLFIRGCNAAVSNSIFDSNYASGIGGALAVDAASGVAILTNLTIINNKSGRSGGGLSVTGGNPQISNARIAHNVAIENGGGIYVRATKGWSLTVQIENSFITGNEAVSGGGVTIESDKNFFTWNTAAEIFMDNVSISENNASTSGGGVTIDIGALKTRQCTIGNNKAANGGGLSFGDGWYKDEQVKKSTFSNNIASNVGGGIHATGSDIQLNQTTFTGNNGLYGGGMFLEQCLQYNSTVSFVQNSAQYSGGGIQMPVTCNTWCTKCTYQNNNAAFGADQSTAPTKMEVWNLIDLLCVFFCYNKHTNNCVTNTYTCYITVGTDLVTISGATNPTFTNGIAQFDFYFVPVYSLKFKAFQTGLSLSITTNVDKSFVESYDITFENVLWKVPDWLWALAILLSSIIAFTVICTGIFTWKYSKQPIIRGATLPFLWMILLGCLLMGAFVFISPLAPQMTDCISQMWLIHLGLMLIIFPIAGKTWRIHNIFFRARKKLQSTNWSTSRLFATFLVIPFIIVAAYLVVWTLLQDWSKQFALDSDGVVYQKCQYISIFTIISMVVGIGFLLWIVQLAVSVRSVPKNFNESRWLGASVYTISIVFLFVIPLAVLHSVHFVAQRVFVAIGCFLVTESVLFFLFGVKFFKIWNGTAQKSNKTKGNEASNVV